MELAIFGDVLDVLDDLCRVLRARLAKLEVSNPPCGSPRVTSSSSSSGTASVVRDQGPAVLRHLDWVSSSLSIVLNTTNNADGSSGSGGGGDASVAPAIRSLLTRKLGDVMESAHQLRPITQDSCEMSASFSTTTNSLKSSFNSSVNVSPVDEQLRAKQIFRTASQNLEDAQRLLRISYPQLLSTAALSAASESRANGYNNTTVGHHTKGEQKPHHSPHIYSPAVPFEAPVLCISPRPGAAEEYDDEYNDCSAPRYSTNTAPYVNRSQSREYSNLRDESSLEPWHQPDTPTDDVISALELDQTARYQEPASSERRGMLETLPSSISQPPAPPAPKPSQRKPPLPLSPSSRKAASSLPPRSPNAQSLKPTVDDDDENDDASGLQTSPHVHRMTGVLWKEILADSRDVLDVTFVKDMLELFNYGETEPQIRKEDVRSLRFSFADNSTLYIRFMLRHRPTLSASDVDLRISLYAFPGMMAMYEERKRLQARQYDDRENHRDNYALRDDLATSTLTGGDGSLSTTVYSDDRALTMSPDVKTAGDMMALAQSSAMPHASSSNTMMSDRSQSSMVPLQGYSFPPGSHYHQVSIPGEHWGAVLPHMTEQTCRSLLIEEVSTLLDVPRGSVEKVVFQLGSLIVGFSIYPPAGGPSRSDIEVALKAFDFPAVRAAYDAACQELRLEKRAVVPEGSPLERMSTGDSQDQRTGAVVRLILPDRGALDRSDDEDITVSSMVLSALSPTMSPTISRATPTLSCNGSSHFSNCVVAVPPARFQQESEEKSALAADEKSPMPTHALVAPSPSSSTHMVSPLLATTRTAQAPRSEQKPRPDDVTSPTQKLSPKVITSESASAAPTATLKATAAPVPSVKAEPAPAAKSTPVPTAKAAPRAATLAVAPAQRQPVQATRDRKEETQKTQQEGQQQAGEQFARNDSAAPREWQPKPLPRHNSARPRTADRLAASARPATSSSAAVAASGSARAAGQPVPSTRHPKPIAASNLRGVKGAAATGSVVSSARGTRREPIVQEQPPAAAVIAEDKSAAAPEATPSSKQEPTTTVPQKHQDPSAKAQTAVVDKKNTPTQLKTNTPEVQTDAKTSSPVVSVSAPIRVESQEAEWAIPEVQPSATGRGEAPEGNSNSRSTGLVVDEGTLTVSRVKGAAARDAGFCPGDTLRTVDGKKITTASDFFAYMASSNRPVAFVTVETSSGAVATRRMVPTRRGDGYQREASASQPAAHRSATGGLLLSDPRRPTHSVPAANNSVAAGSISPQRVDATAEETRPPPERTRINPHRIASTSAQSSARDGVSRSASARYNNNNNRLTRTGSPSTQSHHVQDSVKAPSGNLRGTSQYSAVQSRRI